MVQIVVYALVVLVATIAGSAVGLGGGVVIKPVLDIVSSSPTAVINFYSSLAVFTMSIISMGKHIKNHFKFNKRKLFAIAGGSVVGGLIGQSLLQMITTNVASRTVHITQSVLLCLMLIVVILYSLNKTKIKTHHIENTWVIVLLGIFLGAFSVFLGIGGGPINVAAMMLLFSFDIRESAVYSVGIIFFSQLTKMIMVCLPGHHVPFEWSLAICVMISAVIGGYVGTIINRKVKSNILDWIYNGMIGLLIFVTLGNTIRYIFF